MLTVITTHVNADFDAFASMLAAKKLYPEALVVFPGSQERSLRDFFVKSMVYMYNIVKIKDVDLDAVKRLVLVDTRQAGRIGRLAEIVGRPDVEIHIYDHHPHMPDDLTGTIEVTELTGATVTIMARILRDKNIDVTPEEATIMALGLYEDTGSFTFSSTTEQDYLAAAFLLSKGANLNVVANMITRELSPEQVNLLNEMLKDATHHIIHGVDIVVATVTSETYVADFALLVHKLRDMENLDVVFALASMENRVYMVARSRIPDVDVGDVATAFGGGGHPSAASASVRGQTLIQVKERLFAVLHDIINPKRSAKDLMSAPVIHVNPDVPLREANELLTRYNINVLVVLDSDELVGMISRQVIEKGLHHRLHDLPVREYMTTEIDTIPPDGSLPEIQERIIGNKQRLLPVVVNGHVVGVITRTDLLNVLISKTARIPESVAEGGPEAREKNVTKFLKDRLPDEIVELLGEVGRVASSLGHNAYAVGGFVRDLLLYQENLDIDIVIEGDGIEFAKALASTLGARVRAHAKFRTAVVILPNSRKIDIATARLEYYKSPGAMPTVESGSIKLDLYRRDFTINTLAIRLNPSEFGTLIDYFGGQKDLKAKAIRVLHNLSFVEDPTRVFRAVRFEQRFGFRIGKLTSGLIENAVRMDFFKDVNGRRLFSELRQILEEERPLMALRRLDDYELLKVIHPSLHFDAAFENRLTAVDKVMTWYNLLFLQDPCSKWMVYLLAVMKPFARQLADELCSRLQLVERYRKVFTDEKSRADSILNWLEFQTEIKNHSLYRNLRPFRTEVLLYMMATTSRESVRENFSRFFTRLRPMAPMLTGGDLKRMGFEPGPEFRKILDGLLDARLNGELETREEEIAFVEQRWGNGVME